MFSFAFLLCPTVYYDQIIRFESSWKLLRHSVDLEGHGHSEDQDEDIARYSGAMAKQTQQSAVFGNGVSSHIIGASQ